MSTFVIIKLIISLYINILFINKTMAQQQQSYYVKQVNKIKIKLFNEQILTINRKIISSHQTQNSKIVYELVGLPYAQVPIHERRFKFPERLDKILPYSPFDASMTKMSCSQLKDSTFNNFSGADMWNPQDDTSEDCLYMNIWVPISAEYDRLFMIESSKEDSKMKIINMITNKKDDLKMPTLFWIYGGSYITGNINLGVYDGTLLASHENIIIVSCNYRLGAFGFLYLNTTSVPGNAALADQMLAIEWYKEVYMKFFDASIKNFCLFGESAGSMSIHYHLNSKKNSTFTCAIMQSGSAYLDLAYREPYDALKISLELAKILNCSFDNLNDTIRCLKNVSAYDIVKHQYDIKYVNSYLQMPFVPTSDFHKYVYTNPRNILKYKNQNQTLFIGTNQDEGSFFLMYAYNEKHFNLNEFFLNYSPSNEFVQKRLSEMLYTREYGTDIMGYDFEELDSYTTCLTQLYDTYDGLRFKETMTIDERNLVTWKKISKILGDVTFSCPSISLLKNFQDNLSDTHTYLYKLSHRSSYNPWPKWMGVSHGYEIEYIFGIPFLNESQYTNDDRYVSRIMMNYWANFAKYKKLTSTYNSDNFTINYIDFDFNKTLKSKSDSFDQLDGFNKEFRFCDLYNTILLNTNQTIRKSQLCKDYKRSVSSNNSFVLIDIFKFLLSSTCYF